MFLSFSLVVVLALKVFFTSAPLEPIVRVSISSTTVTSASAMWVVVKSYYFSVLAVPIRPFAVYLVYCKSVKWGYCLWLYYFG
jgi:hypothetical protein